MHISHRWTHRLLALVGVMLALGLTGCGKSEEEDRNDVSQVMTTFYQRIHDGDFPGVCALFDEQTRSGFGNIPCDQAVSAMWQQDGSNPAELINIYVAPELVKIEGDNATVPKSAVTINGHTSTDDDYHLVRQDDEWKIKISLTEPNDSAS